MGNNEVKPGIFFIYPEPGKRIPAIIGIVAFISLLWQDWKIGLAVFIMMWADAVAKSEGR